MKPTEQQEKCVSLALVRDLLKIRACAGAGKTSTLELMANANLKRSIYVAFNKVTAEEAKQRFPAHVTCQTTHSLAFAKFGRDLMDKLSRPRGGYVNVALTGTEIALYYQLKPVGSIATAAAMGLFVRTTVEHFEQSADEELSAFHVPKKAMEKVLKEDPTAANYVLGIAKKMWNDRINRNSKVAATHDTYLKLYQLSKPVLPYQVVYVDEFQDTTPCVLDIILNQRNTAQIVMVGDARQAIYGWRGAVNAMKMVDCEEAPLSQSFRYGQGIADVAQVVLHNDMTLKGLDIVTTIGCNVVDRTQPHMYLFRTNSMLLLEAVEAIDRGEKVKVEIDTKDFVKMLESAMALWRGDIKRVKHEKILPYPTWYELREEAEEDGGELKRLVNIVEGRMAEHIIEVLNRYVAPANPIATYTTAHKAKGRESPQVILANDFPTNYKDGEWVGMNEHEENLLYVAVTRAMRVLEINQSVKEILEKYNMRFVGDDVIDVEATYRDFVQKEIRAMEREVRESVFA